MPADPEIPDVEDLRQALADELGRDQPHVEKIALISAIVGTALERGGMRAMLVGGGAIEFYAPESHTTGDLDFVVEGRSRDVLGQMFEALGFGKSGRHWIIGDWYVEVPGNRLDDPFEEFEVGPYKLRVIGREYILAERVVGFRYWKTWAYGLQAIEMINAFGASVNDEAIRKWLRAEQAEDAYDLLLDLARSSEDVDSAALDRIWHQRYR